jgi:hypothetical protein
MDLKQERQLSFVEALKAMDSMKNDDLVMDYEKEYERALKDIAEVMFDMDFTENNKPIVSPNEEYDEER